MTMARGRRQRNLVNALNAEWDQLVEADRGTVAEWARRQSALEACEGLGHLLDAVRANPDPVLGALVAECASGEELAGRTVLQAMLGKVVRMASSDAWAGVDDYVAAMWMQIRTYPLQTRPVRIAANLGLDTLKAVTAERGWCRAGEVTPYPPDTFVQQTFAALHQAGNRFDPEESALDASRVIRTARSLGLINAEAEAVLTCVYADGLSGKATAERLHTSPGMVRYRCSITVARLARHAPALADAA